MKKIAAFAGAGAMFLATATPAFAIYQYPFFGGSDTTNYAFVQSSVIAQSNTGNNSQLGKSNWLITGDAWAGAKGVVVTNTNVQDCGCQNNGDVTNHAFVGSEVVGASDTGNNHQMSFGFWGGNAAVTGGAGAEAQGWVVTNTNLSGF